MTALRVTLALVFVAVAATRPACAQEAPSPAIPQVVGAQPVEAAAGQAPPVQTPPVAGIPAGGAPVAADPAAAAAGPAALDADALAADVPPLPERLLDRPPFDRVTLNPANNNAVIETVLLDLPQRTVPNPLPGTGDLLLRQLSQPSVQYTVSWSAIAKVELYEQILLAEANRLAAAGQFAEAFEYLVFLRANYPNLSGLEAALQSYLWVEAAAVYGRTDLDGAWTTLVALYQRNPQYARLANAVEAVSDAKIRQALDRGDFAAARAVLDLLRRHFPDLPLANAERWTRQLEQDAQDQLAAARAGIAAGDYDAARAAAMRAEAILPELGEARTLLEEIQRAAPEIRVGVTQFGRHAAAGSASSSAELTWATGRVAPLVNPRLIDVVGFGAEGGVYASPFGDIASEGAGLETTLRLNPAAPRRGVTPDAVARAVVAAASGQADNADFAAAFDAVQLASGNEVRVEWRQSLLHPEALLRLPLRNVAAANPAPGLWFDRQSTRLGATPQAQPEARYRRAGPRDAAAGRPQIVVERLLPDDDATLATLVRGEIDAIDRVPPWQLQRARQSPGVVVGQYALPTVHVLIPNFDNRLLTMREFRRALCYGTDRAGIVRDLLLAGEKVPGFTPLSGPFAAGVGLNDPAGYAYNSEIAPRPYEPRLAALLANVARKTLAERDIAERKARGEEIPPPDPTKEPELPKPDPLVLAYPADPVARMACQALKLQLDRVGIPVTLTELPAGDPDATVKFDLLYAELSVWEPLTDARRVLGAGGVAGRSSALMSAALDELARAQSWNDARARLHEIHRIAHYDLPVVPLWQTVNHFAHRSWLAGVGDRPMTLYQALDSWRKEFDP